MKPILVLQNMHSDSPGYLGTWLLEQGLPVEVRNAAARDPWPASMAGHAGLAVLGGAMSANDPLPFLRATEALILDAMDRDRPVIGHCLGGQLMARALGAPVHASPAPEIGWQAIEIVDDPVAQAWFGPSGPATVMQWHYEAFELPLVPPGWRLPPPARTRPSRSARTWACSSTSRSTRKRCRSGRRRATRCGTRRARGIRSPCRASRR